MPLMKKKNRPSIIEYVMKGPHAIEMRLAQLEKEMQQVRDRLCEIATLSLRLKKSSFLSSTAASSLRLNRVLPKAAAKLSFLGSRTLQELNAEREALKAFIGEHLRAWEVKPTGPAPAI